MKAMIYLSVLGFVAAVAVARPANRIDDRETIRLRALADKLILTSNGLSSVQDSDGLAMAQEYAPLAEYVIRTLERNP